MEKAGSEKKTTLWNCITADLHAVGLNRERATFFRPVSGQICLQEQVSADTGGEDWITAGQDGNISGEAGVEIAKYIGLEATRSGQRGTARQNHRVTLQLDVAGIERGILERRSGPDAAMIDELARDVDAGPGVHRNNSSAGQRSWGRARIEVRIKKFLFV